MLREGVESVSSIARQHGVTRGRVQAIKRRLYHATGSTPNLITSQPYKLASVQSLTIRLTLPIYDALIAACEVANRQESAGEDYEPITIEDYVGELIKNRVVELGLLRYQKRKTK